MEGVFVGDAGPTVRAEVFVTPERLHAERNEAEAEDPAADQDNEEAEEPLQARLFALNLGEGRLAARVALHLKRLAVPRRDAVRSDERGWRRRHYVLDRGRHAVRLPEHRLHDLGLLDGVQVGHCLLLVGLAEHGKLLVVLLGAAGLGIDRFAGVEELGLGVGRHFFQ